MSNNNAFELYEQLRAYQLHCSRMENQNVQVPNHISYSPSVPNLQKAKMYHKYTKDRDIDVENEKIMNKLISINKRKPQLNSQPNFTTLPPIKKKFFEVPQHQSANSSIAKRIINSKPSIDLKKFERNYRSHERMKSNISKYDQNTRVPMNRKKYIAELLLLKKLKMSRVINPQI